MAKGLGGIMAAGELAQKAQAIADLEVPTCPLCGGSMENDGAGWFCYNQKPENVCPEIGRADEAYRHRQNGGGYADDFQGQTLAAIVIGNELIARLSTVRGPCGKTNLRIWNDQCADEDIPELAVKYGWTWQDWLAEFDKGE